MTDTEGVPLYEILLPSGSGNSLQLPKVGYEPVMVSSEEDKMSYECFRETILQREDFIYQEPIFLDQSHRIVLRNLSNFHSIANLCDVVGHELVALFNSGGGALVLGIDTVADPESPIQSGRVIRKVVGIPLGEDGLDTFQQNLMMTTKGTIHPPTVFSTRDLLQVSFATVLQQPKYGPPMAMIPYRVVVRVLVMCKISPSSGLRYCTYDTNGIVFTKDRETGETIVVPFDEAHAADSDEDAELPPIEPQEPMPSTEMNLDFLKHCPEHLPILEKIDDIVQAFRSKEDIFVITGATGSGKSVVTPLLMAELCCAGGVSNSIVILAEVTRVSTLRLAHYMNRLDRLGRGLDPDAFDSSSRVVHMVGGCAPQIHAETRVVVVTYGCLRNLLRNVDNSGVLLDFSRRIAMVVLDEVHHRDANVDIVVALIRSVHSASDARFRVCLMTATPSDGFVSSFRWMLDVSRSALKSAKDMDDNAKLEQTRAKRRRERKPYPDEPAYWSDASDDSEKFGFSKLDPLARTRDETWTPVTVFIRARPFDVCHHYCSERWLMELLHLHPSAAFLSHGAAVGRSFEMSQIDALVRLITQIANGRIDVPPTRLFNSRAFQREARKVRRMTPEQFSAHRENTKTGCHYKRCCVLVFVPGVVYMAQVESRLSADSNNNQRYQVVRLHGDLPIEEMNIAANELAPPGVLKVVLSTNVCESSVTIPHVQYLIDTCLEKISYFNSRKGIVKLKSVMVCQDSLMQRRGRVGRVMPGTAITLCHERCARKRPQHREPELLRSRLVEVILEMMTTSKLTIDHLMSFLPDAPSMTEISHSVYHLEYLRAIEPVKNYVEGFYDLDADDYEDEDQTGQVCHGVTLLGWFLKKFISLELEGALFLLYSFAFGVQHVAVVLCSLRQKANIFGDRDPIKLFIQKTRFACGARSDLFPAYNAYVFWRRNRDAVIKNAITNRPQRHDSEGEPAGQNLTQEQRDCVPEGCVSFADLTYIIRVETEWLQEHSIILRAVRDCDDQVRNLQQALHLINFGPPLTEEDRRRGSYLALQRAFEFIPAVEESETRSNADSSDDPELVESDASGAGDICGVMNDASADLDVGELIPNDVFSLFEDLCSDLWSELTALPSSLLKSVLAKCGGDPVSAWNNLVQLCSEKNPSAPHDANLCDLQRSVASCAGKGKEGLWKLYDPLEQPDCDTAVDCGFRYVSFVDPVTERIHSSSVESPTQLQDWLHYIRSSDCFEDTSVSEVCLVLLAASSFIWGSVIEPTKSGHIEKGVPQDHGSAALLRGNLPPGNALDESIIDLHRKRPMYSGLSFDGRAEGNTMTDFAWLSLCARCGLDITTANMNTVKRGTYSFIDKECLAYLSLSPQDAVPIIPSDPPQVMPLPVVAIFKMCNSRPGSSSDIRRRDDVPCITFGGTTKASLLSSITPLVRMRDQEATILAQSQIQPLAFRPHTMRLLCGIQALLSVPAHLTVCRIVSSPDWMMAPVRSLTPPSNPDLLAAFDLPEMPACAMEALSLSHSGGIVVGHRVVITAHQEKEAVLLIEGSMLPLRWAAASEVIHHVFRNAADDTLIETLPQSNGAYDAPFPGRQCVSHHGVFGDSWHPDNRLWQGLLVPEEVSAVITKLRQYVEDATEELSRRAYRASRLSSRKGQNEADSDEDDDSGQAIDVVLERKTGMSVADARFALLRTLEVALPLKCPAF